MTSYDILKTIVRNGSNLQLNGGISYEVMTELVEIAKRTGASISLSTRMSYEIIAKLSEIGGSTVTFVDGPYPAET